MVMTAAQAAMDPHVQPFWRWEEANRLLKDAIATPSEDKPIQLTVDYLQCGDTSQLPPIDEAFDIYDSDGLLRAEIEARVLAKQSHASIAECCNISVQLLATYETIFFDVRKHHLATDWVTYKTVGMSHWNGFCDHELRQLFALVALSGGEAMLNEMVDSFRRVTRSAKKMKISLFLKKNAPISHSLQAYVAAHVLPQTGSGERWLREYRVQLKEAEKSRDPVRINRVLNQIQTEIILLARKVLAGKLLEDPPPQVRDVNTLKEHLKPANFIKQIQERVLLGAK